MTERIIYRGVDIRTRIRDRRSCLGYTIERLWAPYPFSRSLFRVRKPQGAYLGDWFLAEHQARSAIHNHNRAR